MIMPFILLACFIDLFYLPGLFIYFIFLLYSVVLLKHSSYFALLQDRIARLFYLVHLLSYFA